MGVDSGRVCVLLVPPTLPVPHRSSRFSQPKLTSLYPSLTTLILLLSALQCT